MKEENRIIAIRKKDVMAARQAFGDLMTITENILNKDARLFPDKYKCSASDMEEFSLNAIRIACQGTPFDENEVVLVSGQKFPDIIADKYYGIEVKSTKSNHWTSTGSSIVESTRDVNVEDIYMLFGKLGGIYPEFRCRPYEDVLYDIAVTHSPRYLINMDATMQETIFAKMGVTYNELRKAPDSIDKVRRYYRAKAIASGKQEMPWWITQDNADTPKSFNIVLWNSLLQEEKQELKAKCMILFPEALNPKRSPAKYNQTTLWLCSYNQVVLPNIRDIYSAGGKITHVNGKRLEVPVAQVYYQIVTMVYMIKTMLDDPTKELVLLIQEYNPSLLVSSNLYENWLGVCEGYAVHDNVPLRRWIEEMPDFEFSQK